MRSVGEMQPKRARSLIREGLQHWFKEPCFFGFDDISGLQKCINEGRPFIFADHAYFDRGYEKGNFRVVRGDIHQRAIKRGPIRRTIKVKSWKKGSHILVFPPSYTISKTFDTGTWTADTVAELKKHTDRKIIVKRKEDGPLKKFLEDCHAVVGYGTVASVEAACAGVPVFCGPHCPATPIGLTDLSRIETPIYPEREEWFTSLAWSQFHTSEIQSGFVKRMIDGA